MNPPPLPAFAAFPKAAWKVLLSVDEWNTSLEAWTSLAEAHCSLPEEDFSQRTLGDYTVSAFLSSFMREIAAHGSALLGTSASAKLLLRWEFLSDFSQVYGKKRVSNVLSRISEANQSIVNTSLAAFRRLLLKQLDTGINGDLETLESQLQRLNHLLSSSHSTASFFLAGSEFLDGLVHCYQIMNPPLRKVIMTTTYLSFVGLVDCQPPMLSMLTDQLYALKTAAEIHKASPLIANDSLVTDLVSTTPLLRQIEHNMEKLGVEQARMKVILKDLAALKKPGAGIKAKRLIRRKIDKGKNVAVDESGAISGEAHMYRMSQITQIQDLFPDLGSAFVLKMLNEFDGDPEQVVAHLLEDSLPANLKEADRSEQLSDSPQARRKSSLVPRPKSPLLPVRRNIFDDEELDNLAVGTLRLHIGKRDASKTAEDVLDDRSTAPSKAAILSALATFDLDDDERDDTYDAADVGGTVDATAINEDATDDNEETLWRVYQTDPKSFDRDQATRRGSARTKLKLDTGLTDEAVEGWAVMLGRNPGQRRRLEMKYSAANAFTGQQQELASTAYRAADGSDTEGGRAGSSRGRGERGRGRVGFGRGNDRGVNSAKPRAKQGIEAARRQGDVNKSSRANHKRSDQRA